MGLEKSTKSFDSMLKMTTSISPQFISEKLHLFYRDKRVLVTGGASFIGSSLVELLCGFGAKVSVIDDLSSGKVENFHDVHAINFIQGDLRNRDFANSNIVNFQIVFHLAAIHGGRGFIETYKQEMLVNLVLDNNVFSSAAKNGAEMIIHASSACAYPITLQEHQEDRHLLQEDEASMDLPETSFADGVYGWTKLIGEFQLQNHCSRFTKGRSARIFTAYGEKENESHAAIALIAKCLFHADPFPIWGNGQQTRNFTYVSDTALGLLLLGSDQSSLEYDVFNIGTSTHIKVIDFVEEIFKQLDWRPSLIDYQLDRPTGVASRASNNKKIQEAFGWEPSLGISLGIQRTLQWYCSLENKPKSLSELEKMLASR